MSIPYSKIWLPIEALLAKLEGRGLAIGDRGAAADFLKHINYYCFTGYGLVFEQPRHRYLPGTSFEEIRKVYEFDRALRDLLTESIELVELDLRTTIAHAFAQIHGPFGHTDSSRFFHQNRHGEWLETLRDEAKRATDAFVEHYKATYQEYPDLPIWVATEIMSFGSLSRMLQCMSRNDQKRVAGRYGLQPRTLVSCVHHLVYIRNLCAHHARIWDREWAITPELPAGNAWISPLLPHGSRLFASLLVQAAFLRNIRAEKALISVWKQRVENAIETQLPACPAPLARMGFPANWKTHPVWRQFA